MDWTPWGASCHLPYYPLNYKHRVLEQYLSFLYAFLFEWCQMALPPPFVSCTINNFIIFSSAMDQTLRHFNQYSTESNLHWPGLTSNRFPKPRLMLPRRDIIRPGLELPDETVHSGRKHFEPQRSGEFVFRPRLKQVGEMEHWHLRPSSKRILDLQFSQPHPRRQKAHFPTTPRGKQIEFAGVRTFYNSRLREGTTEYSLEDRMQRKVRIDQLSLRKNAFKNESLSMSVPLKGFKF